MTTQEIDYDIIGYSAICPCCSKVFTSTSYNVTDPNKKYQRNPAKTVNYSIRDHCVNCHPEESISMLNGNNDNNDNNPFMKYNNLLGQSFQNISDGQRAKLDEWVAKKREADSTLTKKRKRKRDELEAQEQELVNREQELVNREQELVNRVQELVNRVQELEAQVQEYINRVQELEAQNKVLTNTNKKITSKLWDISDIVSA